MPRLVSLRKSPKKGKKWEAVFDMGKGKRSRTTHFGGEGYSDYTIHKDKERRRRYRIRHSNDIVKGDPTKAGMLAFNLLWGESTSLSKNVSSYKKKHVL